MIGLIPSYKLEEIDLILFFKSSIIQIFAHQVCMSSLSYTVKLVESCKLYHTNRLIEERLYSFFLLSGVYYIFMWIQFYVFGFYISSLLIFVRYIVKLLSPVEYFTFQI